MTDDLYIIYDGPIDDSPIASLIQQLDPYLSANQINKIILLLNSPGGSVNAGILFYNYLRGLSISVDTHNMGQVDSIGNVVFLAGDHRTAAPGSSFLLHGVSLTLGANTVLSKSQLSELLSRMTQDEKRIKTIISERTSLLTQRLAGFFRSGRSVSPDEARRFGFITDVATFTIPNDAKRIVVNTFASND